MLKLSKKKLMLMPVVLLLVFGVVYMKVLKAKPVPPKMKVDGTLVSLGDEFVINLSGGHYGKVSVALLLSKAPPAAAATDASGDPVLEQNAAVRAVITDELTGLTPNDLINRSERHRVVARLESALKSRTDEPVTQVLLTDVAVQ
jgi:flagellar basal body-associated protein FliL